MIAVVKANAYGHGLVSAALALGGADAFAVARLEEGMSLRAAGITARIVLLEGVFSRAQMEDAAHDRLDLVVHDARQIELLESSGAAGRFALWIKIDTGMNRLGFAPQDFAAALERIRVLQPAAAGTAPDDAPGARRRARRGGHARAARPLRGGHPRPGLETSIVNSAGLLGSCRCGASGCAPGSRSMAPLPSRTSRRSSLDSSR